MLGIDADGRVKDVKNSVKLFDDNIIKDLSQEQKKQNALVVKQLNLYGKQVVDKMIKDNIPPTPANYAIYFEKVLEEKPLSQKQSIDNILDGEKIEDFDYILKVENNIHSGFIEIRDMMETISSIYSKINKLRTITKAKKEELSKGVNKLNMISYEEDLQDILAVLTNQQRLMKEKYNKIAKIIKNFNSESIFDKKYGVYNKKYLLKAIDYEKSNISTFGHTSTLLALQIQKSSLQDIRLTRDRDLIVKTVGKMILKRSRRSDIVTHFDDGIFIIILKHTDTKQAEKTIESIEHMISFSNYIVDSQSIEIKLDFALSEILPKKTKEQIIATVLDRLPN